MIRLMGNGLSRVLITVFTSFTVMAGFCFAAVEPLRIASFSVERAGNTGERIDRVISSPVEEPALFTKTEESQFASMRAKFQRIINPGENWSASCLFCRSSFGPSSNVDLLQIKNSILLKLRI
jgi:hypothetical protein